MENWPLPECHRVSLFIAPPPTAYKDENGYVDWVEWAAMALACSPTLASELPGRILSRSSGDFGHSLCLDRQLFSD